MTYNKPPLSCEELADILIARGMEADRSELIEKLRSVSYYRLSGYWYPFRMSDVNNPKRKLDTFEPGTEFGAVRERYQFDHDLRLIVLSAIEPIEIAVRTILAHEHSINYGPFAYATDDATFPHAEPERLLQFRQAINEERERSREPFVEHFREKYGDQHGHLPVWMAAELMSFGSVLTMLRSSDVTLKRAVADRFCVSHQVFESWFRTLHIVRNICAHHGRLWNRELGVKPAIPRDHRWHVPVRIESSRVFGVLTICKWCLDCIDKSHHWCNEIRALFQRYPGIPARDMGIPNQWQTSPLWEKAAP